MNTFILKGNIFYSTGRKECRWLENGYLACVNGICRGAFSAIPEEYKDLPVKDYGNRLLVPGFVDLHIHAPQYTFRGLGMDLELMEWLDTYTFPEESRYADLEYARKAYSLFANDLKMGCTTRAAVFATAHTEPTWLLMDELEKTGLITMVGRVNMDANGPDNLREKDAAYSYAETLRWLEKAGQYSRTKPILTPRFVPSCSSKLMQSLGELAKGRGIPVQSHLSENFGEISLVKELFPDSACYAQVYEHFGLLGEHGKCIMAHCVHSSDVERELLRERGVYIAHSPESNMNLASGVAPVSKYLDLGLKVGLATDVAGGSNADMFRAMAHAVQASKLLWRLHDQEMKPLTFEEVFYLATLGGGSFFGNVGSFRDGDEMDVLVLDDSPIPSAMELSIPQRVERMAYLFVPQCLKAKYVAGRQIF